MSNLNSPPIFFLKYILPCSFSSKSQHLVNWTGYIQTLYQQPSILKVFCLKDIRTVHPYGIYYATKLQVVNKKENPVQNVITLVIYNPIQKHKTKILNNILIEITT
jgi:hypothetical protein